MPKLNKHQKAKENQQTLEETLFPQATQNRSRIILNTENIEEEPISPEDSGIYIPPKPIQDEHSIMQECYTLGRSEFTNCYELK